MASNKFRFLVLGTLLLGTVSLAAFILLTLPLYGMLATKTNEVSASTRSVTITPEADAYVRAGLFDKDKNFGNRSVLRVNTYSVSMYTFESFVRFSVSQVSGDVSEAQVKLCIQSAENLDLLGESREHEALALSDNSELTPEQETRSDSRLLKRKEMLR